MLYINSKFTTSEMSLARKKFNPTSFSEKNKAPKSWTLETEGRNYSWKSKLERVAISREGVPFSALEVIGKKINLPIRDVLTIFEIPQTTYNKKRRENALLGGKESEAVLLITEILDFGIEVFNGETEKFLRWLKKPNPSLGGMYPESFFDSITGIQEVKNCLNRLEYGNLA